ncbi:hypothetical protein HHK36_028862 [Tetracentron sinense]|uniref:F-box domain-containing protein n=1 Tax=Tetracentron sinense TaxID=13715 RepID=A0A834YGL3_TETSI|nr:hypothetical protein HHK36_028862 [Tetracentron sinense]
MENCSDFLHWLGTDVSIKILMYLEDSSDLVRVSSVSRSWHQFVLRKDFDTSLYAVIGNGLCKLLCLRRFPEVSSVARVIEINNKIEPMGVGSNNSMEWESLKRDHRVYAFFAQGLMSFMIKDCSLNAISASSTDNYPEESIQNTLVPGDRDEERPSYWSSEGKSDPSVPETLTYKLITNLWVITEISVQPFQAYFQVGVPIYSAKAVRFRMGHLRSPMEIGSDFLDGFAADRISVDDKFTWTYTSPEFPMAQEKSLQKFKLPEPVLCFGGFLQIELLGRVQRQEMDGLFYICVAHVQVMGRPLVPSFDVEMIDLSGKCMLKYYPEAEFSTSEGEPSAPSSLRTLTARFMQRGVMSWEQMILNLFPGNAAGDNESDEELFASS